MHEILQFIKDDKLGFALLLILFALSALIPAHILRVWKSKRGEDDPEQKGSGKRLAFLEAERERRQQEHFRRVHDIAGIVTELGFRVNTMRKEVDDLARRVGDGEDATAEFRDRLLRVELTATAFARDARAAIQSLERPSQKET